MNVQQRILSCSISALVIVVAGPAFADCSALPNFSQLRSALISAITPAAGANGGLGFNMWRIAGMAPRSSLIVTDEALSSETGKGTDFVVLLSGEPQGGIKSRRRGPGTEFRYARPRDRLFYFRSPFGSPFSTW